MAIFAIKQNMRVEITSQVLSTIQTFRTSTFFVRLFQLRSTEFQFTKINTFLRSLAWFRKFPRVNLIVVQLRYRFRPYVLRQTISLNDRSREQMFYSTTRICINVFSVVSFITPANPEKFVSIKSYPFTTISEAE